MVIRSFVLEACCWR